MIRSQFLRSGRPVGLAVACAHVLMLSVFAMPAWAQGEVVSREAMAEKVLRHIPRDAIGVVSIWPKQLAAKERMRLAPLEVISAVGLEQAGLDPLQIERIDLVAGFLGPFGPQFGALIQMSQPLDIHQLPEQLFDGSGLQEEGDFEFLLLDGPEELVLHQVDPVTALLGTKSFAKQMVASREDEGKLASIVAKIRSEQDLLAIVSISAVRPMITGILENAPGLLPGPIADDLRIVVDSTDFIALRGVVAESEKLQLAAAAIDEASANNLEQSLRRMLEFARLAIVSDIKSEIPADSPSGVAMHQYIERLSGEIVEMASPKRRGNRLIVELEELRNISVVGTLTGLLVPAVSASRMAARRMQSANNLKQIGLALHNFNAAYNAFPAAAGVDDEGEPSISWRVAILPFIEQQALYEKFHLDEPWDSEHNLTLLDQMPPVFRHPDRPTEAGHTVYQAIVGEETVLKPTEPTTFHEITDGTSNTIMVMETTAEVAVPWTAPQDVVFDPDNLPTDFFVNGISQALFADGSVQVISENIDLSILTALFTRAGGERVDR